jgi:outer membrane protein, heavy metal efflux system
MACRTVGIGLIASILAAGCASISYDQLGHDVGQVVKSSSGVAPQWRLTADESLRRTVNERLAAGVTADSAVEVYLLASPDLQASFERLGLARADYLQAATLSDPVVSWSRQSLRGGPGSKLEWSVLQNISDLFALPVRRRAADRELNRARLTAANEILAGIANVRSAWLEALAAEKIAGLAAERSDLARLEAELMERFVQAGNEPDTELQAQRLAYAEQQRASAAAESERLQARVRLERLIGVSDLQLAWSLRGEFAPLPGNDGELTDLAAAALRNRLDMQAARQRVEAHLALLSNARQKRLIPELAVGYGSERDPDGTRLTGPQFELQPPIFSAAQVALARSDAAARLAMREAEAAALDVRGDVRLARARVAVARAALLLARDTSVPAAEIRAELRHREYLYMIIGPFAAMQARGAVMEAKLRQLQAERDYWLARIALSQAAALPLQAIREWVANE